MLLIEEWGINCFSSKEKHLQNSVNTLSLTTMGMSLLCVNVLSIITLKHVPVTTV